jgi:hypothetical protein
MAAAVAWCALVRVCATRPVCDNTPPELRGRALTRGLHDARPLRRL